MSEMVDGVWTDQRYVDFGLEGGATEVAFSPDGGTIYFLSRQMLDEERGACRIEDAPERIWYATRTSDGFGQPKLVSVDFTEYPTHTPRTENRFPVTACPNTTSVRVSCLALAANLVSPTPATSPRPSPRAVRSRKSGYETAPNGVPSDAR
jgi:hypothetical protein